MERNSSWWLLPAMFLVAACEITLHWLMARNVFPTLMAVYLYTDPIGRNLYAGFVDNLFPAVILGSVNGWVGFPKWSRRRLAIFVFFLATFVEGVRIVDGALIGWHRFRFVWGSVKSVQGAVIGDLIFTLLVLAAFTFGAYGFCREWKKRQGQV